MLAPPTHVMVHVRLANGAAIMMSPGHSTIDRRSFGDLSLGDRFDDLAIESSQLIRLERRVLRARRAGWQHAQSKRRTPVPLRFVTV
jgi:hypothetical protein